VAVVQYTYTHKQHRERQKKNEIHRTTQKLARVLAVPCLCAFYPGVCLTTEEKQGKTTVRGDSCCFFGPVYKNVRIAAASNKNKKKTKQNTQTFYERYRTEKTKLV
jgi:hypothetical protein